MSFEVINYKDMRAGDLLMPQLDLDMFPHHRRVYLLCSKPDEHAHAAYVQFLANDTTAIVNRVGGNFGLVKWVLVSRERSDS